MIKVLFICHGTINKMGECFLSFSAMKGHFLQGILYMEKEWNILKMS